MNASISLARTTLHQRPKESKTLYELMVRKETKKRGKSTPSLIKALKEPVIVLKEGRKETRGSEICRGEVRAF